MQISKIIYCKEKCVIKFYDNFSLFYFYTNRINVCINFINTSLHLYMSVLNPRFIRLYYLVKSAE